jgi:hypothetical protein
VRTPLWESGPRASWIRVARVNSCVEGVPGLATEGVIKTPAVLQEDAELRKAATAVLAGSAGILQAGSAASGCARVTKGVIENLKPPVSPTGGETCFSED